MTLKNLVTGFALLVAGSVNAAAIFTPADGHVNYFDTNITLDALTPIAMFNVGDLGGFEIAVVLDETHSASIAEFAPSGLNKLVAVRPDSDPSSTAFDSMTLFG